MSMRLMFAAVILGAALAMGGCSTTGDPQAGDAGRDAQRFEDLSQEEASATLDMTATQIRLIAGGKWGQGVLHYQGNDYPFTLKGGTAGGVGYTSAAITGVV